MDFDDVKGYFTTPNMVMVTGAVGGFVLGGIVGNWIAGKIGTGGVQKAIAMLVGGLGVGALLYAAGRSMEPGSSLKPAMYGLAIGAAMPGVMAMLSTIFNTNETTKPLAAMFARGLGEEQGIVVERVE